MFTFNGVTATTMGLGVTDIRRSVMPEIRRSTQEVAGMAGTYTFGTTVMERKIEVDVYLVGTTLNSTMSEIRTIAQYLYSNTPMELSFDDDSGITYYAQLDGSTDLEAIGRYRKGTLSFVCSDPFAYGPDETVSISEGTNTLTNNGGVECFPVLAFTPSGPTTFIKITNTDTEEFIQLGEPAAAEDTTLVSPQETILLESFSGETMEWSHTTKAIPGHDSNLPDDMGNRMEMAAGSGVYYADDYGTGTNIWHGPCIYEDLSEQIQDFSIHFQFNFRNTVPSNSLGKLHLYVYDDAGVEPTNIIGGCGIYDQYTSVSRMIWEAWAGEQGTVDYHQLVSRLAGTSPSVWNDPWPGRLILRRIGNVWTFGMAKMKNGVWSWRASGSWTDEDEWSTTPIARVGIHMAQYSDKAVCNAIYANNLIVAKVPGGEVDLPTTLLNEGTEEFTFDMRQGTVLMDGSPQSRIPDVPLSALLYYSSTFFPLATGSNTVTIEMDEGVTATGTATIPKRYL